MSEEFHGHDRREFVRLEYSKPLAYKVCKAEIISKLFNGYTMNVSQTGLLCNIRDQVKVEDILWLSFDKSVLHICTDVEKNSLIYQNGIIGKVVRVENNPDGTFHVGVKFFTREEKNISNIYPKVYFQQKHEDE
jgi:hypothetical protein